MLLTPRVAFPWLRAIELGLGSWPVHESTPSTAVGMVLELPERGFHTRVEPTRAHAFGSWRTARETEVDAVITVLQRKGELESGWVVPAGATVIGAYEPLTPPERWQPLRLEQRMRSALGPGAATRALAVDNSMGRAWIAKALGRDEAQVVEHLPKLESRGNSYSVCPIPSRGT